MGVWALKALSPIIAAAILIVAVVAAGLVFYNYAMSNVSALAQKPQLVITVDTSEVAGVTYLEVSVKNIGGAPITVTSATIDETIDITAQLGLPIVLQPGSELHKVVTATLAPGEHIIVIEGTDNTGNTYEFKAKFIGGSATAGTGGTTS